MTFHNLAKWKTKNVKLFQSQLRIVCPLTKILGTTVSVILNLVVVVVPVAVVVLISLNHFQKFSTLLINLQLLSKLYLCICVFAQCAMHFDQICICVFVYLHSVQCTPVTWESYF